CRRRAARAWRASCTTAWRRSSAWPICPDSVGDRLVVDMPAGWQSGRAPDLLQLVDDGPRRIHHAGQDRLHLASGRRRQLVAAALGLLLERRIVRRVEERLAEEGNA